MATVNIDRRLDDPFNRYQMPKLIVQQQGGKSILVNLADVGHALHREPLYLAKFFSYEFGVPVRMDNKTNLYIISGSHSRDVLQNALDRFIECFVLCSECDNPETEFTVRHRKTDELRKVCAACGHSDADKMASHRLAAFIIKNLQDTTTSKTANVLFKDRPKELLHAGIDDADDIDDLSQYQSLSALIEKKKKEKQLIDLDAMKEIITHVEQGNLMEKASFVIARSLFTENILKEIDEYRFLIEQLCKTNTKGQKYLLYALEVLIHEQKHIRRQILHAKLICELFSKLHQYQIIDRSTFIDWYENPPKSLLIDQSTSKKIRQKSKEFIEQLNQINDSTSDNESASFDSLDN